MSETVDRTVSIKLQYDISDPWNKVKMLEEQMKRFNEMSKNSVMGQLINPSQIDQATRGMKGFTDKIEEARTRAEALYDQLQKKPTSPELNKQFNSALTTLKILNNEQRGFNSLLDQGSTKAKLFGGALEGIGNSMKHHLNWLAAGAALYSVVELPKKVVEIATETDATLTKIRQNLELFDKYESNPQALDKDIQHLSNTANLFAIGFSADLNQVLEVFSLLSRRFKDTNELIAMSAHTLTLAKLDNVPLLQAANGIEAIALQFHMSAEEIGKWVNSATVAVHTSRILGSELFDALQRSGSAFKAFNMNAEQATAFVAAMASTTAQSGSIIGNSWRSILSNLTMDKAAKALETYGVKLYETQANGTKAMRQGVNVFNEIVSLYNRLDDQGKQKLADSLAGGKYQIGRLMAFLADTSKTYDKLMKDMTTKASDDLTNKLLAMGLDNFQAKLLRLKASFQVLGQTIGNDMIPKIEELVDGLNRNLYWITQNKEGVDKLVKGIALLVEMFIAWKAQVVLVNSTQYLLNETLLGTGARIAGIYAMEGNYVAAMSVMREATASFGATLATVAWQAGLAYLAINVFKAVSDRISDKSGVTGKLQDLENQRSYLSSAKNNGQWAAQRAGISKEEYNAKVNQQIKDLDSKIAALKAQKATNDNKALADAMAAKEEAIKKIMADYQKQTPSTPTITNQLEGKNNNKGGNKALPDTSNMLDTIGDVNQQSKVLTFIDNINNKLKEYDKTLEQISKREQLYGRTEQTLAEKEKVLAERKKYANDELYNTNQKILQLEKQLGSTNAEIGSLEKNIKSGVVKTKVTSSDGSSVQTILTTAAKQVGEAYRKGVFDCSKFTQDTYAKAGIHIPRVAQDQFNAATNKVYSKADLKPGMLVFFGTPGNIHHVGIYAGDGKMYDNNHSGGSVGLRNIYSDFAAGGYVGGISSSGNTTSTTKTIFNDKLGDKKRLEEDIRKLKDMQEKLSDQKKNDVLSQIEDKLKGDVEIYKQWVEIRERDKDLSLAILGPYATEAQTRQVQIEALTDEIARTNKLIEVKKKQKEEAEKARELEQAQALDKTIKELTLDTQKYANEKKKLSSPENRYNDFTKDLDNRTQLELLGIPRNDNSDQERLVKIKEIQQQLNEAKRTLAEMMETEPENKDGITKMQIEVRQLEKDLDELKNNHMDNVRTYWADAITDMALEGKSLKDIWKALWADMAREAIHRLFQVKTEASILSQMLGFFGIGKGSPKGVQGDAIPSVVGHNGGIIPHVQKYHSGGVVKKDLWESLSNLKSNEVPSVLLEGEEVLSHKDRRTVEIQADLINKISKDFAQQQNLGYIPTIQSPEVKQALQENSLNSQAVSAQMKQMQIMDMKLDSFAETMGQLADKVNNQAQPIIIQANDAASFVEMLNRNGDSLVNVIRQQKALGNNPLR